MYTCILKFGLDLFTFINRFGFCLHFNRPWWFSSSELRCNCSSEWFNFLQRKKIHSMQMLQCTVLHIIQDRQNLKHFFYARDPCILSILVLDSVTILTWNSYQNMQNYGFS